MIDLKETEYEELHNRIKSLEDQNEMLIKAVSGLVYALNVKNMNSIVNPLFSGVNPFTEPCGCKNTGK